MVEAANNFTYKLTRDGVFGSWKIVGRLFVDERGTSAWRVDLLPVRGGQSSGYWVEQGEVYSIDERLADTGAQNIVRRRIVEIDVAEKDAILTGISEWNNGLSQ